MQILESIFRLVFALLNVCKVCLGLVGHDLLFCPPAQKSMQCHLSIIGVALYTSPNQLTCWRRCLCFFFLVACVTPFAFFLFSFLFLFLCSTLFSLALVALPLLLSSATTTTTATPTTTYSWHFAYARYVRQSLSSR